MRIIVSCAVLIGLLAMGCSKEPSPYAHVPGAAKDILAIAYAYPAGGGYLLRDTGVPEDIRHADALILPRDPRGTYCCGFTFAVAMKAARERGLLDNVTVDQVRRFQKEWYGAAKDARVKECAVAVVNLGIGIEVTNPADARPGDFVKFGRRRTGHSVVFLEWVHLRGKIIGIRYYSSQPSTNGIGEGLEFFNTSGISGGEVDPNHIYIARLNPPK